MEKTVFLSVMGTYAAVLCFLVFMFGRVFGAW